MLGIDPLGFALVAGGGQQVVQPQIAPVLPRHLAAGASVDDHVADRVAAAHAQRLVDDGLQRQRLAATLLLVGSDHHHRAGVLDAVAQRLRREAAEHHGVRRADARAGLHRGHALDRHRQVDHDAIALLHAARLQRVGEAADQREQLAVADAAHRTVVGLEDDRRALAQPALDVAVQAVVRHVQPSVGEPLEERPLARIEHLGERLVPAQQLARLRRPEALVVGFGLLHQLAVGVHAADIGPLDQGRRRVVELGVCAVAHRCLQGCHRSLAAGATARGDCRRHG